MTTNDPLQILRRNREQRETSVTTTYFHAVAKAAGKLATEAAAKRAAAELEQAAVAAQRSDADVEADVERLRELQGLDAMRIDRAHEDLRVRRQDLGRREQEAEAALKAATETLRRIRTVDADEVRAQQDHLNRQRARIAELRGQLRDSGCPAELLEPAS